MRGKRAERPVEREEPDEVVDAVETDETVEASEAPGIGHNVPKPDPLTEDQRIALTILHKNAYVTALAAKKAADKAIKDIAKIAKAELGADAVADIKQIIELETEEGEKRQKAEIERAMRVARWMNVPYGSQAHLFGEPDRTPAVDRAYSEGKLDGLAGKDQVSHYAPSTEQYNKYLEGWSDGQKVLAAGIRPLTPIEEASIQPDVEFDDLPAAEAMH